MDPAAAALDTTPSSDGGKVKKVKKRPRIGSCIPCSKRRQKCDRAQPCSSCISKGTSLLCKWDAIPDGPSPGRSADNEIDLTTEEGEDDNFGGDEIPPALRTTKLDLNENREMLKMLSKRIQSLESRVVLTTGPASAPAAMGPSMSLDVPGSGLGYGSQVEGTNPGPFLSASPGGSAGGGFGSYEYISSTPGSASLYEVSPAASVTSPPSQSPQIHVPVKPPASRRHSEVSFGAVSVSHDELYRPIVPFTLVQSGEFIGRGNTAGALHSICSSSPFQLPQAKIAAPTSMSLLRTTSFTQTLIPTPEVEHLIQYLPSIQNGNVMIEAFFKEVNWRYGIPEKWFSATSCQMWTSLQSPTPLSHQLNPYWLCLFFSVLACAPQSPEDSPQSSRPPNAFDSDTYFICASAARRIAEDNFFRSSSNMPLDRLAPHASPTDGCVLGCLAIPLLCDFLAERGRISEAWKLMGNGIRTAQSIGLHRDPASPVWQEIPEEEKDLRRGAWWGLYIWDRLFSYTLGRPQMVRGDICDVAKPLSVDGKGRRNSYNMSRVVMIQLADLVSEILDKCINSEYPAWPIFIEMDTKFDNWELGIPPELRPGTTPEQEIILFVGLSQSEIQSYTRHRYMITTWYRFTRLKLYTLALKRHQSLVSPAMRVESPGPIRTCAEQGIRFALELIKYQCGTFDRMQRTKFGERWLGGNWYFEGCLSLFEAAVALVLVLTKFRTNFFSLPGTNVIEDTNKWLKLEYEEMTRVISRVVDVFSEVVVTEKDLASNGKAKEGKRAEIASKALDALQVLLKEHWWKLDPRIDQAVSVQGIDSSSGLRTSTSSVQSSPRRTGSTPASGMVDSGPEFSYGGAGYNSTNIGSTLSSQQMVNTQAYSGLATPVTEKTTPSPSSIQQPDYQMESSGYGSMAQYPMTIYPSSYFQPPFESTPLSAGVTAYPQYPQDPTPESASATSPSNPMRHHLNPNPSPYDYQPENYSFGSRFSGMVESSKYPTPLPFNPMSKPSQVVGQDQSQTRMYQDQSESRNQPQEYQQQRMVQRHRRSSSTLTQPTLLEPSPAASAYAYDPSSSSSSRTTGPIRSSPGVPPPGQGMKMIHYVAPGSTTSTTTTASGMGVIGSSAGTLSFTVSSQEPIRQQQSTIVLSDFMGPKMPSGTLGDSSGAGNASSGGYYQ